MESPIKKLTTKEAVTILDKLEENYPEANCELNFGSPFQLLIATLLSAQSTDKTVNKVTERLFKKFPKVEDFLGLSQEQLENEIREIGIYRNKAKNILALCNKLILNYHGEVPRTMEELVTLPGIGRKTANVVLSNAFKVPALAVDTHVQRVSNRIGLAKSDKVEQTEDQLTSIIPKERWSKAHHLLIWHGRRTCHARNPECYRCSILPYCGYPSKKLQ